MEEIVNTDVIRSEILEDARRKAARLLEEGEAEAARNVAEIEAKAAEVVEEIFRDSAAKSARYRMETMARFPLERTRMRTTFVDSRLREAVSRYVEALPEEIVAELADEMLSRGSEFFAGKDVELRRKGVSELAARKTAASALREAASVRIAEDDGLPARGLVASSADGGVRLRATMDLVERRLLDEERGGLARALCAGALEIGSSDGRETAGRSRAP